MDSKYVVHGQGALGIQRFDDQLSTYLQQWQADQQKQIMLKMASKSPIRSSEVKGKNIE
jgi:hypothetical protein